MLRTADAADVEKYAAAWYRLATDSTRSGYPSYCNGIKTERDFTAELLRCIDGKDRGALVYETDGAPRGSVYLTGNEVFGVDIDGERNDLVTKLLRAAAADATGPIIFFCDRTELAAAESAGFAKTGEYVLYEKCL